MASNFNTDDYITLSPHGLPLAKPVGGTVDSKTPIKLCAAAIEQYYWALIKDTLQGSASFDEHKTTALYKNHLNAFVGKPGRKLIAAMRKKNEFLPIIKLIDEGLARNPNKAKPIKAWHDEMRQYVTTNILPPNKLDLPNFVETLNSTYFVENPGDNGQPYSAARLATTLLTPGTVYAARMPSVSDIEREVKSASITKKMGRKHVSSTIVSFPIIDNPDTKYALAVMRAKAETASDGKIWPKDAAEKSALVNACLEDVELATQCPDTILNIAYNSTGKATAYMLMQETAPTTVNVSYMCSIKNGGATNLWQHLIYNHADITSITANNVDNPKTRAYYASKGFKSTGDVNSQTNDMLLTNGKLVEMRRDLSKKLVAPK